MTKNELKTGMYLEMSSGEIRIVLLNTGNGDVTATFESKQINGFTRLYNYFSLDNLDSNFDYDVAGKVMKVYSEYGSLLWERKEVIELTIDQIAEKFNVPVSQLKIIK